LEWTLLQCAGCIESVHEGSRELTPSVTVSRVTQGAQRQQEEAWTGQGEESDTGEAKRGNDGPRERWRGKPLDVRPESSIIGLSVGEEVASDEWSRDAFMADEEHQELKSEEVIKEWWLILFIQIDQTNVDKRRFLGLASKIGLGVCKGIAPEPEETSSTLMAGWLCLRPIKWSGINAAFANASTDGRRYGLMGVRKGAPPFKLVIGEGGLRN
jgi:hypothetical protein